ncbi:MAG: hypothetical protein IPF79_05755 [Ignavibacteria bacterium]|nr:hypothetical protein [Ignavibacteria bacterium]
MALLRSIPFFDNVQDNFTKKGLATCWILEGDTESDVSGFYTLSATSVTAEVAKVAVTRGLPSEIPIPAVLIGQLAVDQRFQGQARAYY